MADENLLLRILGDSTEGQAAVKELVSKLGEAEESMGTLQETAIALGAALVAVTGTIIELGIKGSEVNDVRDGFDRLAGSVGQANDILDTMRQGVAGTIDDLQLMTDANKLLATGAVTSAEGFGSLTEASRVLSREGFGPTQDVMQSLSNAMETGRTRRLALMGVTVDAKGAEADYAASLGIQASQLSASQKLFADRQAVMTAMQKVVADAGTQEMTFGEQMISRGCLARDDRCLQ